MVSAIAAEPEWCLRIRHLVETLSLTQAALAERLGVSPATVSRWMQGKIEPTAEGYVALSNLAPPSDNFYFLERAGLNVVELGGAGQRHAAASLRTRLQDLKVITLKRAAPARDAGNDPDAVAIPLLRLKASMNAPPHSTLSLAEAEVEQIVIVPLAWCPHPEQTVGMQLADDAMSPVIPADSILVFDTADNNRESVRGSIVVVSHRDLGFRAGRLQRYGGTDLLMPANNRYAPLDVNNTSKWKVCGRVLWWIGRDGTPAGQ